MKNANAPKASAPNTNWQEIVERLRVSEEILRRITFTSAGNSHGVDIVCPTLEDWDRYSRVSLALAEAEKMVHFTVPRTVINKGAVVGVITDNMSCSCPDCCGGDFYNESPQSDPGECELQQTAESVKVEMRDIIKSNSNLFDLADALNSYLFPTKCGKRKDDSK